MGFGPPLPRGAPQLDLGGLGERPVPGRAAGDPEIARVAEGPARRDPRGEGSGRPAGHLRQRVADSAREDGGPGGPGAPPGGAPGPGPPGLAAGAARPAGRGGRLLRQPPRRGRRPGVRDAAAGDGLRSDPGTELHGLLKAASPAGFGNRSRKSAIRNPVTGSPSFTSEKTWGRVRKSSSFAGRKKPRPLSRVTRGWPALNCVIVRQEGGASRLATGQARPLAGAMVRSTLAKPSSRRMTRSAPSAFRIT